MIKVQNLNKTFKQYKKAPGLWGAFKSVFSRQFTDIAAVKDVSFEIQEGEFVGFIGSNGAGKTTTLKMLSGLVNPTEGTVEVMGYKPWKRERAYLKQIGLVMGQKNQLWWDLPARDSFELNREIYEIPKEQFRKRLDELVDVLEIGDVIDKQVRKLSLGQRMKCELVSSLLHNPKVVFLDEPTIGLDVVMQQKLREFFKDYNKRYNTTIMLTSHYMDDVKELCDRIIVLNEGVVVYDGDLEAMVKKYASHKNIHIVLKSRVKLDNVHGYGEVVDTGTNHFTVSVSRKDVPAVSAKILQELRVEDLDIKELPLEEIVRRIFKQTKGTF